MDMDKNESDIMRIAAYAASDLSSWGMALGEMLRAMEFMDKTLASAVEEKANFTRTSQQRPK